MSIKWIGAALILSACGWVGFSAAASYLREATCLQQLIRGLDFMGCELQYRLTPLPQLAQMASQAVKGPVAGVFREFSCELRRQVSADVSACMHSAVGRTQRLPPQTAALLRRLGNTLGCFDLEGQMQGLAAVREECAKALAQCQANKSDRVRGYRTLGICAGAAVAILFL